MSEDRDPTIGALLDRVDPPPAPNPAFWDELRAQLDGGPRVVELRPVGPAPRDPSRRRFVAALVAAAVLAAGIVGITKAVRHDDSERLVPASPTTTVSEARSLISSTVTTWIEHLQRGDAEAAWEMVGPQSREVVDQAAFDGMLSDLRATWAPWGGTGIERRVLQLSHPTDEWWIETMLSPTRDGVQALAVHRTGTAVFVEPFVPGTALSLISFPVSQGAPVVDPGSTLQIHVDGDAMNRLVAIDGTQVDPGSIQRSANGALVGVPAPTHPGHHDLLVAEVTSSGAVVLDDQAFRVTG